VSQPLAAHSVFVVTNWSLPHDAVSAVDVDNLAGGRWKPVREQCDNGFGHGLEVHSIPSQGHGSPRLHLHF
jgi:hypothetical protein